MTADDIDCLRRLAVSVRLTEEEQGSVKRVLVALGEAEALPPIGKSPMSPIPRVKNRIANLEQANAAIDAAIERAQKKP